MTSLPPDPYKTLGVSKDAQITEIRSAHRKLVLKCHPDKVQDPDLKALAQDEFQKVQRAYEILSDEKERQRYDDQARLAELRKQMQAKANTSSPRATPTTYKYEVRTAEPRPSSYKSTPGTSPSTKSFYPRSYEDTRGPQIFDAEPRMRRESSYSDKPSKREVEREREKKEERERSKKLAENLRRMEKEAKEQKEARRAEKKKEREKERKREAADKKAHSKPYIESYEDEVLVKEKKKSSKKHDEKRDRDRSSHREEAMPKMNAVHDPMPEEPYLEDKVAETFDQALSYIQARNRSKAYHATRLQPPAAPTPPPAPGQSSPFAPPDDDARRSSARVRRGSSGEKKAHKKPSNEVLDDPIIVNTSPSARYAGRSATNATAAGLSGSPPRRELHRQYSSPVDEMASRPPMPAMSRSQTFTAGLYPEMADPRGRGRSKQHPQIQEESDSDDDRAQRHRDRKHRSSKKYRSPSRPAQQVHYKVEKGHATLHTTYSRSMEPMVDTYSYYPTTHGIQVQETRPSMSARDASYSSSPGNYMPFHKVKTSRAYDYDDVAFSNNYPHHDEYAEAY